MEEREAFLLRIDVRIVDAVRRWADDNLRSLNGRTGFLLPCALKEHGRPKDGIPNFRRGGLTRNLLPPNVVYGIEPGEYSREQMSEEQ